MLTVGTFNLKTHLSAWLARVEAGEEVIITKRGKAVARIIPEVGKKDEIIRRIKQLSEGATLNGLSWKDLRDEGRR